MSHQSGISASDELKEVVSLSKDGRFRLLKIAVKNEQLVPVSQLPPSGSVEQDYKLLESEVRASDRSAEACYLFFRLDSTNNLGYDWLFVAYVPDLANSRAKMLNASTRATLRLEFGTGFIKHDIFGSSPEEVSWVAFQEKLHGSSNPPPLTMREQEMMDLNRQGVGAEINVATKHELIKSVRFPLTEDAKLALDRFKHVAQTRLNYVQLAVDLEHEQVVLAATQSLPNVESLGPQLPLENARFHLYLFEHVHQGQTLQSVIFIYSMPSAVQSIKEKMLYSSCKGALIDHIEREIQIQINKKLEVSDGSEVSERALLLELHPPPADAGIGKSSSGSTMRFQRPAAPGARAPR